MSDFQKAYTVAIVLMVILLWHRQRYAAVSLLIAHMMTLGACLAMDLRALTESGADKSMMLIDLVAMAVLVVRPGLCSLIAAGYMAGIALYAVSWFIHAPRESHYAIQNAIAALQLAVLGIGGLGGISGGGWHRRLGVLRLLGLAPRNKALSFSQNSGNISSREKIAEDAGRADV